MRVAMTLWLALAAFSSPELASASAEEETGIVISGKLSLEDAVKLALVHNRALQIATEERNKAKGRILEAYAEALPQATVDGKYERLSEVASFVLPPELGGREVPLGYLNNYSVELNVTQPLVRGGRVSAALSASRLFRSLTDENVKAAVQDTIYRTTRGFYRTLLLEEQYEVTENYVRLAEAHLKDTETKRKFGVASDFNLLRSKVELSNARAQSISYKNQVHLAASDLMRIMGVSQDSRVELSHTLDYRPVKVEESEAVRIALRKRPDLAGADLSVKLQTESLKDAVSRYWPEVDAFFRDKLGKPDPQQATLNEWGNTWSAGLTVKFKLFDGLRRKGRVIQERAALKQLEIGRLDARARALFEVRTSVLTLEDAAESVEAQRLTVEEANEGLRLAEVGYREGTLDQVSVLEARASLTQSTLLYYTTLYDHALARLELERATGQLGIETPEN